MNDSTSDIVRPGEHAARFADWVFCVWCLFRAVTMQGESLRFAFVLTWKKTQTTHPNTRKQSAIVLCPYLEKNTDHTDAGVPPAATRRSRFAKARELLPQPLWRCLKDWSSTHSSSKAAAKGESLLEP